MYRIVWEDSEIFDDQLIDADDMHLISPKLVMEVDQAGSLEFTVPPTHWVYDSIDQGLLDRVIVSVVDDEYNDIWNGRVMSVDLDFNNCKVVYCEGALSWLNDCYPAYQSFVNGGIIGGNAPGRTNAYWLLNNLLGCYNTYRNTQSSLAEDKVESRYTIQTKYSYVTAETDASSENQNVALWSPTESVYDQLMSLKDTWGGYMITVWNSDDSSIMIQWWKDMWKDKTEQQAHANAAEAVFGENLLDMVKTRSMDEVVTYLHPIGASVETQYAQEKYMDENPSHMSGITYYPGWWIDDNGNFVELANDYPNRTRYVTSQTLDAGTAANKALRYYYSGRIKGNYAKWAVLDRHRVPIIVEKSGAKKEKDDHGNWQDTIASSDLDEITIPKEGRFLRFAWYEDPDYKDEDDHTIPFADYSFIHTEQRDTEPLEDVVTIASVNNGSPYLIIHPGQSSQYGSGAWIEKTVEWPDINVPQGLLSVANDYYAEVAFEEISYEIKYIDMGFVDKYSIPDTWTSPRLLGCVHVISEPHNVDTYMYITRIEIPFDNIANISITLGKPVNKNLTDVIRNNK